MRYYGVYRTDNFVANCVRYYYIKGRRNATPPLVCPISKAKQEYRKLLSLCAERRAKGQITEKPHTITVAICPDCIYCSDTQNITWPLFWRLMNLRTKLRIRETEKLAYEISSALPFTPKGVDMLIARYAIDLK